MVASTLSTGDIAIIQVDSDDADDPHINGTQPMQRDTISFVLLAPVGSGTQVFFTDRTWTHSGSTLNSGSFSSSGTDGTYTWTAASNLEAGTVITITEAELQSAGIELAGDSGETIYVYQGTNANTPTKFLFAMEIGDSNTAFNSNIANTGLALGIDTVSIAEDNGSFGERLWNVNAPVLYQNIVNHTNWNKNDNSPQNDHVEGTNLHVAPDVQLWVAGISGGHGLMSVSGDATQNGGLGYNVQTFFQNTASDGNGLTSTQRFWSPTHIQFDTVGDKFFIVDSSGTHDRILQGNISDILNNPGSAPTMTILWSDQPAISDGDGITGIQIDKANGDIYFTADNKLHRIDYNTANQTAVTLADLGNDSDSGNKNYANELALDLTNGRAFIISTETFSDYIAVAPGTPGAVEDPPGSGNWALLTTTVYQNSIHMVENIASGDTNATGNTITQLNFNEAFDEDNGSFGAQSNEFDDVFGRITDVEVNSLTGEIWFTSVQLYNGVNGAVGGIYKATLSGSTLNVTQIASEGGSNRNYQHIHIDEETGHYYVSSLEPGEQGNHAIYRGSLTAAAGTSPILYADVGNVNEMTPRDMTLESAPTLTGAANAGLAVTEASTAPNSGETTAIDLYPALTAADIDTPDSGDELRGAVVRISDGHVYETASTATGHTASVDYLKINNATSGTISGSGITFSYDPATGMMTLSGAATTAEYAAAINMVTFSTSGDNVTDNGDSPTRTINASVFDGLLYSDEVSATVTVTGTNDAPVNAVGGAMNFTEDTTGTVGSAGPPIIVPRNAITGISIADADADATSDVFTVTLSVQHGTLTIRTDVTGGITASDITGGANGSSTITITGTQTEINTTLTAVNSSAQPNALVYTPAANYNGADTLTVTTNDGGNSGTGGAGIDSDTKTINLAEVNDAPTVGGDGGEKPAAILEDTPLGSGSAPTVATVFGGQFSDALDVQVSGTNPTGSPGDAFAGIAVVTNGSSSAVGHWQYWDGAAWQNIGVPGAGAATFVRADAPIRFAPALDYNGPAPQLVVHLVEASGATPTTNGAGINLLVTPIGGTSHISNGTVTLDQDVTAVNDAPVVVNGTTETLTTIVEDATNPAGESVSSLFAGHFNDSKDDVGDSTANTFAGIAVTANPATAAEGKWQYSPDGSSWTDLPPVTADGALALAPDALLRFLPAADFNGSVPQLTVHLIDDTAGVVATGGTLDLTTTGGSTPYSAPMTLGQSVTAVNDAPSLTPGGDVTILEDHGAFTLTGWATGISAGPANESSQGLTISTSVLSSDFNFTSVPSVNVVTGNLTFTAAANESGTASIQVVITDDGGTPGVLADDLSQTHTFTITIDAVNDAPVNTVGGTANAAEDGPAVALTGIFISDVDADSASDVMTVTLSVANGTLTILDTVSGGLAAAGIEGQGTDTLTLTGTLDAINATLSAASSLMYTPDADFSGADALTVTTNDGGASGGAAQQDVEVKTINVAATNDAPTLSNDAVLIGTAEDTATAGESVSDVLFNAGYADADGPSTGMAVTGLSGNGTWQYSTDGGTSWHAVGPVSDASALLLSGTSLIRYIPDGANGETPAISFRGWDGTSGTPTSGATRSTGDSTVNGADTAFSVAEQAGSLTVTDVNDAPSIGGDGTEVLASVDEDSVNPAGETVQTLFAGQFADVDTGDAFAGIAVVGSTATAAEGVWQYFNGTGWVSLASASPNNAVLLAPDAKIRFLPAADFNGAVPSLNVRLVDDSGPAFATGDTVDLDVAGTGGSSRIDDANVVLGTDIDPVNDAPDAGSGVDLAAIDEDTANPAGETVSSLFGGLFPDADGDGLAGIAVVGNAATTEGTWQYFNGASWVGIGTPTAASALVLDGSTLVRFVPAANFNGDAPALTVHLIDDSAGAVTTGDTADLTTNGGTTQYSDDPVAIGQDIAPVNDRPDFQLSNVGPSATLDYLEDGGAQAIAPTALLSDIDSLNFDGGTLTVSFSVGGTATDQLGILDVGNIETSGSDVLYNNVVIGTFSGGANGTNLVVTFDADASPEATEALVRAISYDTSSDTPSTGTRNVLFQVTDGDGGDEMAQAAAAVNVTLANDAPTIDAPAEHSGDEDQTVVFSGVNAISIDDADIGSGAASVVLQVGDGTLTLGSTAGLLQVIGNGGGTVALTGTVAAVNAALDGLTYQGSANSHGDRNLTISVSDNGLTGPNLIVNPGAELGNSAGDFSSSDVPFGWSLVGGSGGMTAVQYGIGGADDLNAADSTAVGGGDDYFAGGPGNAASSISQTIDVSGHAAKIDAGSMLANVSGFFGGYLTQNDAMTMTVRFLDANGNQLGSETIGGADAADRSNATTLVPDATVAFVPALTRSIEVVLTSAHSDGAYTDGYADNLSLTLAELVAETVTIDIEAVNDPVSVTLPAATFAGNEEQGIAVTGVAISDIDATLDPSGEYTVTLSTADGTLTLGTPTGLDFTAGDGTGDSTMTFKGTLSEVNTALGSLSFTGATDFVGSAEIDVSVTDATATGASSGSGAPTNDSDTVQVDVANVNDAPVMDLNGAASGAGATLAYSENGPAAPIAPDATVADSDSTDFGGGSLSVALTGNGDADDRLSLSDGGGITVTGGTISYLNTNIGTVSGGNAVGDPLEISFNSSADDAAVEAVLQRISYHNVSDDPSTLARTITYTLTDGDGGTQTGTATALVNVAAVDDPGAPKNDSFTTTEAAAVTGNVLGNDPDVDSTPTVASVNGSAADGTPVTLASGARVTMNSDGSFEYDPNGAFDHLAQSGLGAFNDEATDSFTYTLADGTSATVLVKVTGLDSDPHYMSGTAGDDTISGTSGTDIFQLFAGGNDDVDGLGGNDFLQLGGTMTGSDRLDGGTGHDLVWLNGDYSAGLVFASETMRNVEVAVLSAGYGYSLETADETVGDGEKLSVNGVQLGAADELVFDGSNETDGNFQLIGGAGDDTLTGGDGDDVLVGNGGTNSLDGGDGDDIYVVRSATDQITELENGGIDLVRAFADFTLGEHVDNLFLYGAAREGTGNGLDNLVTGTVGADTLNGGGGDDRLVGLAGIDTLHGGEGEDTLSGGASADVLHGDAGKDRLAGGASGDTLNGGLDGDLLIGGAGNDIMSGGDGNDVLMGQANTDILTGNLGVDTFDFRTGDSGATLGAADRITDFSQAEGDRIHLRDMDAVEGTAAIDGFTFLGKDAFSSDGVGGELRYSSFGGNTYLQGDTDGDGTADFFIRIDGLVPLTENDLLI